MQVGFKEVIAFIGTVLLYLIVPAVNAEVSISGLEGAASDNVRIMLSLAKEKCDAPRWKIENLFAQSEQEIDPALRAVGFYHPVIKKSLAFNQGCWQANFNIDAGAQVIVKTINITINGGAHDDSEFKKLRDKLVLKTGQPLRHNNYEKMKSQLASLAAQRGYLNSEFTSKKLVIDKSHNSASFELVFDSGKRQQFGEIIIEQDALEPELVAKYIAIKSGDFYSSEQLVETYDALSKSGYFSSIDIRPATDSNGKPVPVTIKLHPKPKYHYAFGIGFDTDIGILASASYQNNRLNKLGHFLTADLDIAPVLSTANVEYTVPLESPLTETFSVGFGVKREDTDTFNSLSAKLSGRYKYTFDSGWKQTLFLDYSYEDFQTGTDPRGQTLLLVPGGNWLYSVADNPMRPSKGYRLKFDVAGSYKSPLSDVSFAQSSMAATWIQNLPWSGGKFIGRTELGATATNDFDKLPTTYRFYAGGISSVRGYAYKELGPTDAQGNVIGGQYLTVFSTEYEHTIFDDWGVAAFIDAGNAFNTVNNINLKTGAGLGARWYSPFGPVRVDVAIPLSPADSAFQIHFSAGARL
ncbi:MAG: autotransporter assembly complex family protein [Methylococcales bacterium]|nr:autotransporter assembly complex family protein [Methylococcales bacterium]MDP3837839.1 autotransporter assembly complex family protein [Methylococcales bacterium]